LPKVGDTLKLDSPELGDPPLIGGWSAPEPTGRWAFGEATIAWCVRGHNHDLTVLIDGVPALHEKVPLQPVELWANDRRLASWRSQIEALSSQPARILVPRDLILNRDVLMLTFLVRRPAKHAPGLHLRSLTLEPQGKTERR
jgi:hypothetical protein